MNGRTRRAIFGALIVAAWAVPGVSTHVAAETTMSCTGEADFSLSPGLSTSPSSGSFKTSQPGSVDCEGTKGTIEFSGKYGTKDPDSCSSGGEGVATVIYKFADGTVTDDGEYTYGPFQGGALGGSYKGARTSDTFEVTSLEGDCVSKPITKAHAVFRNIVIKR
jgi:hypothetical protein